MESAIPILTRAPEHDTCKICGSSRLRLFAHTATCSDCGVLLNYPYTPARENDHLGSSPRPERIAEAQRNWLAWYVQSGARNHHNFTDMVTFALDDSDRDKQLAVLDYGGGGGQFSLVMRSLYPKSTVYIVDMMDESLLDDFRPMCRQIPFRKFASDETRFDVIFMNDVFEHLTDPVGVLTQLRKKLKPGGRIFIDTPRVFWLYTSLKSFLPAIQRKILKGTVNSDHQQIWSAKSFQLAAQKAGLAIDKKEHVSEYTQGAKFYLDNMGVSNVFVRAAGFALLAISPYIARNKIAAVLRDCPQTPTSQEPP